MPLKPEATDLSLLRLGADGDQRALAELYRRHVALCTRRAFDVIRDRDLAEDAVQEAFVDLWKKSALFDPARASVLTWLCVLVHRRSVDIVRKEASRKFSGEDLNAVEPESYTAEEILILEIDRREVQTALGHLSSAHRQVLELAYYGGLSQSEVAKHLNIPVGTIKSRTSNALAKLAPMFEQVLPEAA
jgi:RNA polymerase sigma-70 factor (ECF subfamily)